MVNGSYKTGTLTLSADKLLRKEFVERYIIKKMNPQLYFLGLFPTYDTKGATSFTYFRDDESAEDDIVKGVMTEPLPVTEMSNLSKLDVSPISKKTGDMYRFGYEIKYSEEKARENGFVDEILRTYDRAAYGMARKINLDTLHIIDANAEATPIELNDGTWDNSSAINEDFIDMQYSFEDTEGWDYTITNGFLNTKNYRETDKFYSALDKFNPADTEGINLTNTKKAVPAGTFYGIDKNIKPITMYKYVNPKHSTISADDKKGHSMGGLINIHFKETDEFPFTNKIQMWCEIGFAVKHPKAILKQTGL